MDTKVVKEFIDNVSKVIGCIDCCSGDIGYSLNNLFDTVGYNMNVDALELLYNQVYLEKIIKEYEEIITKKYEEILGVPREQFGELDNKLYHDYCGWIDGIILFAWDFDKDRTLNLTNVKAKIAEVERVFREFQKQVIFKDVQSEKLII